MKSLLTLVGAGVFLAATGVSAQDVSDPAGPDVEPVQAPEPIQTQDIPPSETPEPQVPPPMEPASFTDDQIAAFARAALQMRELNADPGIDDLDRRKQAEMMIAEEGLDPETYSAIGAAASNDPSIAQRVQVAVEEIAGEAPE